MVTIAEHTLFQEVDGEFVVLNCRSGEYLGLNEIATCIWRALADGHSPEQIVGELTARYEVEPGVAEADLKDVLAELAQAGVITQ